MQWMTVLNQQTAKIYFRKIFFRHTGNADFPRKLKAPTRKFLSEVLILLPKVSGSSDQPTDWNVWSFPVHFTAKSPSLGLLPPGRRQRESGPQQRTAWSIMVRIITVLMQLHVWIPIQRRTVNPSIKENSWSITSSHKSSTRNKTTLHHKPDQCWTLIK